MQIGLGIFTLVGVIMLVLSGASFGYLLQVKNKSRASWMLLWFFLCVILSSVAIILTNANTIWAWAFAPSQDALLVFGGVFLLRYAYDFPSDNQPREARVVISIFSILVIAVLGYAIFFAYLFLANLPAQIDENRAIYLITPLAVVFAVTIFFRRSLHWSTLLNGQPVKKESWKKKLKLIINPSSLAALGLRNFGLALAIALIPVVIFLIKPILPPVISSFLFNFGTVIAIGAMMLVYLNHAPEPTTITAKLVGISLVIVLLILGVTSVWLTIDSPSDQVQKTISIFLILVPICSLLIIMLPPVIFRSTLLQPLKGLLDGVREVNRGNLAIQVDIKYDDEVGFLTQSFNGMVRTIQTITSELEKTALNLETQVAKRTQDLKATNEFLAREIKDRIEAEAKLDRQLVYEQALAGCSRVLLLPGEDVQARMNILNQALEYLRKGANASRAYIFENFNDPDHGLSIRMLAETCAPGILPQIQNPANQNFPWSRLPESMVETLKAAQAYGGPTERAFSSTPALMEAFLRQEKPLLSIQLFPILIGNLWWGFIGFDDCTSPREWEPREISMLRIASEMVGNTVQRWQVETRLQDTLRQLEERVQERTIQYIRANQELRHEIHERQRFQEELMDRLKTERALATISGRLLTSSKLEAAILESIADLGMMINARQVHFLQLPSTPIQIIPEVIEWHNPDGFDQQLEDERWCDFSFIWGIRQLHCKQPFYMSDLSESSDSSSIDRQLLLKQKISSLLVLPLCIDDELTGAILCTNLDIPKTMLPEYIQTLDVIADMISSLLHRASLLNLLEAKVAERTRELATFFDMTMLAGEATQLTDIMQPAVVKIIEINTSDAALLHVVNEEQHSLQLIAQRGFAAESVSQLREFPFDDEIKTWLFQLNEDNGNETGISIHPPAPFVFYEFPSSLHTPLRARGKVHGLLSCYRQGDNGFDPYQVNFMSFIGEQLGIAVENYKLRLKAEEVATIQERQRLARELHDAVSQSLYSLVLYARSGRDALETGDQVKLEDSLVQVEVSSQATLKEMRLLLYQLRSWSLEAGGLAAALKSRIDLVERRSGVQVQVAIDETVEIPYQVEQELFLMILEALNNALKHSGASQVSVTLKKENGRIVLLVIDNGKGFDPSQVTAGMGLQNIHDRAMILRGEFELSSTPGMGTTIRVEIPQKKVASMDRLL